MSLILPLPTPLSGSLSGGGGGGGNTIIEGDSSIQITDTGTTAQIEATLNGIITFIVNEFGRFGINVLSADQKRLEINDPNGDMIRLIYNDSDGSPSNYSDIDIDNTGQLLLSSTGDNIIIDNNNSFNISGHNGTDTGLKLNNVLVCATASELNYNCDTTIGIANPLKTLIPDLNNDLINFNILGTTVLNATTLNSTGTNIGINTTAPNSQLEINSSTGNCLRLTYNDSNGSAVNFTDFIVDSDGDLYINPSNKNLFIEIDDISNNNIVDVLQLNRTSSNTALNNMGVGISFNTENSSNILKTICSIQSKYTDVTNDTENSSIIFNTISNGLLTQRCDINHLGQLSVTNVIETSDRRMKENIKDVNLFDSFTKISKIKLKDYNFIDDPEKKIKRGIIAQELKQIIPTAVEISKRNGYDDFHGVDTRELLSHLIGSVQYIINKLKLE